MVNVYRVPTQHVSPAAPRLVGVSTRSRLNCVMNTTRKPSRTFQAEPCNRDCELRVRISRGPLPAQLFSRKLTIMATKRTVNDASTPMKQQTSIDKLKDVAVVLKTYAIGAADTFWNVAENLGTAVGLNIAPRVSIRPLNDKVCIVTGGNAGIGLATAELLASRGAHVILACRSRERGEAAAAAIRSNCKLVPGAGVDQPKVECMEVDMASLNSVRRFCSAFNARQLPLHLLVANAGIMSPATRLQTVDGLEMQFQVNFLSHWLMTHSLLQEQRLRRAKMYNKTSNKKQGALIDSSDSLQLIVTSGSSMYKAATATGSVSTASTTVVAADSSQGDEGEFPGWGLHDHGTRVVMVSSLTHHAGILNWKDKQSETKYDPFTSYALSKLANVMAARELHRRLATPQSPDSVAKYGADSVVSVHPGVVYTYLATNFFKSQGILPFIPNPQRVVNAIVDTVGPVLMKTTANSAAGVAVAALAPARQVGGKYLVNGKVTNPASAALEDSLARELWETAENLTGYVPHECMRG